ncbi:MAG TPA: putative quinol monooxygenase [Candidatus Saccharimonadales bacterium]|nr:putative quinol monooxygenase [Candidatus Saccharimonadales bacterium]
MAKRKTKRAPKRAARRKSKKVDLWSAARLPKEALSLVVSLRARTGQQLLLEAELKALVGPTRKEVGCITYDLHRSLDSAEGFLLHEIWATRDAHTAHTKTPHFLRWEARKDSLLASRDLSFWKFSY